MLRATASPGQGLLGAKPYAGKRRRQRSTAAGHAGGEVFLVTARSHAPACRRKTAGPWAQQEASTAPSTERRGGGRGLVPGFFALAPEKVLYYEPHRAARKLIKWLYGATAARLTPDQKVGSSNLSAVISRNTFIELDLHGFGKDGTAPLATDSCCARRRLLARACSGSSFPAPSPTLESVGVRGASRRKSYYMTIR